MAVETVSSLLPAPQQTLSSRQAVIEDQLRQERLQREELSRQLQANTNMSRTCHEHVTNMSRTCHEHATNMTHVSTQCVNCVKMCRCGMMRIWSHAEICRVLSDPIFHPDCAGVGRKTESSRESARGMHLHFNIVM